MCNGMNCPYEKRWTGECSLGGRNIPEDAACQEHVEVVCMSCNHAMTRDDFEDNDRHCEKCGSDRVDYI